MKILFVQLCSIAFWQSLNGFHNRSQVVQSVLQAVLIDAYKVASKVVWVQSVVLKKIAIRIFTGQAVFKLSYSLAKFLQMSLNLRSFNYGHEGLLMNKQHLMKLECDLKRRADRVRIQLRSICRDKASLDDALMDIESLRITVEHAHRAILKQAREQVND